MLELDTTIMTPASVFEASGHVARFADWMVKDTHTGDVLRADHLVKAVLGARLAGDREARGIAEEQKEKEEDKKRKKKVKTTAVRLPDEVLQEYECVLAQVRPVSMFQSARVTGSLHQLDNYSGPQLGQLCRKYEIKNPDTGNDVGEPQQFNLMFSSSIGPTGQHPGYVHSHTCPRDVSQEYTIAAICGPKQHRAILSTLRVCSTSTMAEYHSRLLRLGDLFETKSHPARGCCVYASSRWARSSTTSTRLISHSRVSRLFDTLSSHSSTTTHSNLGQ